jgi:HPt (histidine-containing phosphotransfer) domain-containing protein
MTADAMKGVKESVLEVGANDYITKPIEPNILHKVLTNFIELDLEINDDNPATTYQSSTMSEGNLGGTIYLESHSALSRIGNNRALYLSLLNKFIQQFSNVADELQTLLSHQDWETLSLATHTVKGVSANIGAVPLSLRAKELEQHAKACNAEQFSKQFESFSNELRSTITAIEEYVNTHKEDSTPSANFEEQQDGDYSTLKPYLIKLEQACGLSKAKVAKDLVHEMSGYQWNLKLIDKVKGIGNLVKRYQFKQAQMAISQLIEETEEVK